MGEVRGEIGGGNQGREGGGERDFLCVWRGDAGENDPRSTKVNVGLVGGR